MSKLLDYHRTIGAELTELKNRVRHLPGNTEHWLIDEHHKESLLKNILELHIELDHIDLASAKWTVN